MSDDPKFVILRGRPKILVDGQELGSAPAPEEALRIAMENPDPERGWEWRSIGRAPLKLTTREVENSGPGVLHVDHLHG